MISLENDSVRFDDVKSVIDIIIEKIKVFEILVGGFGFLISLLDVI